MNNVLLPGAIITITEKVNHFSSIPLTETPLVESIVVLYRN